MDGDDDDRLGRLLFGEDAITGSVRLLIGIVLFAVIFGIFFWWIGPGR